MSRALPKYNKRRVGIIGGAAAVVLSGAVIAGSALAGEGADNGQDAAGAASPGTISCPAVEGSLPAIPASAQAEVDRNLAQLQTQIQEANQRLIDTVGQGGPNFVQNAILGPLEDKRVAALNRIETAIGRAAAKPEGLEALAPCQLNQGGAAGAGQETGAAAGGAADAGAGADAGDAGNAGAPGTISCPAVEGSLPAIPASAQAEVDRNLALLDTQIQEANQRLIDTVGQGGANFVQNAILGPLEDKRVATLNRIETAIGRAAAKPEGLEALAPCELNEGAAAGAGEQADAGAEAGAEAGAGEEAGAGADEGAADAGNAGAAGTISCPAVEGSLPAIPASAQAEVDRNLALLDTQIQEANQRLIDTVGQGGPNFVDNAILGPLEDKRVAALNRIETAIGRAAAKPEGLEALAPCQLNQ
ncbi:hypothetical protein J8M51_12615 [Streptomyces scabiei]|nr:hypothetical protein [Streptomyces griseiscabiei]